MPSLLSVLEAHPRRTLQAIAASHHLPFSPRRPKAEELARLHRLLNDDARLRRTIEALGPTDLAALRAVQAQGGCMPLIEFCTAFGAIRPYRPWREDSPQAPWRAPTSPAERLWFLALVGVQGDVICLPDEVRDALPALPRLAPEAPPPVPPCSPDTLLTDLSSLLGLLPRVGGGIRHGRWLPPRALRAINRRLLHHDDLEGVRSELQTNRLRLLHYLAEVGGLVSAQNGSLLPTVSAWRWLDAPPGDRWAALWAAWQADMRQHHRLWDIYRLPGVSARLWDALWVVLADVPVGQGTSIPSLLLALRPLVPGEGRMRPALTGLLGGPLAGAGLAAFDGVTVALTAAGHCAAAGDIPALDEPSSASLVVGAEALRAVVPPVCHARPYAEALAWAGGEGRDLVIGPVEVHRAAGLGMDAWDMAGVLAGLVGEPLAPEAVERLGAWQRRARRLRLGRLWVLSSPDPDLLADLRGRRRLAPAFGRALSPHHVVVRPQHVGTLSARLRRRGISPPVKASPDGAAPHCDQAMAAGTAAYLWLAVTVYRRLSRFAPLPVSIPAQVAEDIGGLLTPGARDDLRQIGDELIEALARAIRGLPAQPAPLRGDAAASREAVEAACRQQTPITIRYLDAAGQASCRTIEPVMVFEQGGAWYVEAWCRLAEDLRTFRGDRILGVGTDS